MPLYILTGNFTAAAMKGMIANPTDREAATRPLVEASGGKLISYYITTGESDFMMLVEFEDAADMIAPLIVAGAAGTVSHLKTVRAFTTAEFTEFQKKAGTLVSGYKPPNA